MTDTEETTGASAATGTHDGDGAGGYAIATLTLRGVLVRVLVAALLGALAGLIPLAQYTCAMFLWKDSSLSVQPVVSDEGPIPAALVWHPRTYRLLTALGGMPMALALTLYLCLAACGAYMVLRVLNPTFRVTTGVDWNRWLLLKTYMHTAPMIKAIVTVVPCLVVVFFLWLAVSGAVGGGLASSVAAAALSGAAVWLALSRNGFVGDLESGNYLLPNRRETLSLLLRGAAAGVVVLFLARCVLEVQPERVLRLARSLGGVGEERWRPAAALWLGACAAGSAGAMLGIVGLGSPGAGLRWLAVLTGGSTLWLGAIAAAVYGLLPSYCADRLDYLWAQGKPLARFASIREKPVPVMVAVPAGGRWKVRPVGDRGSSGVPLSEKAVDAVRRHLALRGYRTALGVQGTLTLYDAAVRNLDLAGRLAAPAEGLKRLGDPLLAQILLSDLWHLAGSPEATRATEWFRRPGVFAYLTDDARVVPGDLCVRNGRIEEALRWYREGGLPRSGAQARAARMAVFSEGSVEGRVLVDGKAEVRVGALPEQSELAALMRMKGTSPLEATVLRDVMRATRVAPDGRFRMENLLEGRYRLLLHVTSRKGTTLTVRSTPTAAEMWFVDADHPRVELGAIEITLR